MISEIINTCFLTTNESRSIAYYTHLIPAIILLVMAIFVLIKKGRNSLSNSFFAFTLFLSLWLIGDLVTWVVNDYSLVVFAWSLLDFIEILFFFFGVYFFIDYLKKDRVKKIVSYSIAILALPAFFITLFGYSGTTFDHSFCELQENTFLVNYRVAMDILSIVTLFFITFFAYKTNKEHRKEIVTMSSSLLLLLLTFLITGYIASVTYVYEILLYGLFALPVFVAVMMFSIVKYEIFELRAWSQQLIAYSLVVLVASKIFFANGTVDFILNIVTFLLSVVFVYTLTRSIKKEDAQKRKIEALNKELETSNAKLRELDQQKTEFISLASHQLRGPLTAIKGYASMVMEGDFGKVPSQIKEAIETIFKSTEALVIIVGDYLDISRIESGKMKYDFVDFDLKELATSLITELTPNVQSSNLTMEFSADEKFDYFVRGDRGKLKQVMSNLIDNATKYTKRGGITVTLSRNKKDDILVMIKDTGVGITPDVLPRLFERFSRAPDASKSNIMGTGLGLYVARKMIEAHRGKIWVESAGKDKGSTFFIELEPLNSSKKPQFKDTIKGRLTADHDE